MRIKRAAKPKLSAQELAEKHDEFCDHPDRVDKLRELAADLGVSFYASLRFGVGWNGWAWTFPMRDAAERLTGFRLRRPDGQKRSVRGGREGLFYNEHRVAHVDCFVCEGPTDTLALLSIGIDAVGRPSCTGCAGMVLDLLPNAQRITIVADNDEPGLKGARGLASKLIETHGADCVHVVAPARHKDAREFVAAGGERESIMDCISNKQSNSDWDYL